MINKKVKKIFNRPLSPHITIYNSQITSIYSIWHRFCGIFLNFFIILNILVLKFFLLNIYILSLLKIDYLLYQNIYFFIFSFFFIYHMLNGVRHLSWDLNYNLIIESVLKTANFNIFLLVVYFFLYVLKILY